jgi:hypothetical protein
MLVGGVEGVSDCEVTESSAELGRRVAAVRTLQMSGAITLHLAVPLVLQYKHCSESYSELTVSHVVRFNTTKNI